MEDSSARASGRSHTRPGNNGAALGRTAPCPVRSLATEFPRRLWLLIGCGFLGLFPRFLLLLLGDIGAESLRVDFKESGSDAQWVVILVFGRPLSGAQKHCFEDEHCQFSLSCWRKLGDCSSSSSTSHCENAFVSMIANLQNSVPVQATTPRQKGEAARRSPAPSSEPASILDISKSEAQNNCL